jgi:type II secretory pathway pseudopilin PulG
MELLNRSRGLTIVEMLTTVGMVGILKAILVTLFFQTQDSVKTQRLVSDIESLNRSVTAYRANRGTLASNFTAQDVISKLKTVGDADTRRSLPGYRGSY